MSDEKPAPNIIDNSPGRELVLVIKDQLKKSKEAKFAIGYFFLSGFSLVKDDFPDSYNNFPFLKIVMGNETTPETKEELVEGYNLREEFKRRMIEDLQKLEPTEEQITRLRTLKEFIANNVIDVRLFDKSRLHAKLYLFLTNPEEKFSSPGLAIVGSSNFTAEGLTKNKELNVLLTERGDVLYLNQWFDNLWDEAVEFREDLLKVIEYSGVLPESEYPKIGTFVDPQTLFRYLVYRWFEGRVLNLLKRDILMEFQLIGVLNIVNTLNFYNGAIVADSVGLGKSFMAAAVIEEFLSGKHPMWTPEYKKQRGVLLILPPSIISQWEELIIGRMDEKVRERFARGEKVKPISDYFFKDNYKRLIKDAENYKVYEIYDRTGENLYGRVAFLSLGIFQNYRVDEKKGYVHPELKKLAEEYDLFVIDEAHKYRNRNTNRHKAVRKLQKKSDGFPNKILLLTATPLNNSINDIFNLIRLFNEDTFAPFNIKGVSVINLIKKYNDLKKELEKRDDSAIRRELKKVASDIKRKILDEIMILRTRKYIIEQFKDLKVNGKPLIFRDPIINSLEYSSFYTDDYHKLIKTISEKLNYLLFEHTKLYGARYVVFEEDAVEDEEGEKRFIEIADLFKLLLGKRLESSIYSFETTLRRIYEKEKIFYTIFKSEWEDITTRESLRERILEAIEKAKIKKDTEKLLEEYAVEEEDEENWFDRVVRILLEYGEELKEKERDYSDFEVIKLGLRKVLSNLENDLRIIDEILRDLNKLKEEKNGEFKTLGKIPKKEEDIVELPVFCYTNDPKLDALKQILGNPHYKSEKLKDIPSLNGKKIIIFTQYRDTAYYLYHNLLEWAEKESDLHLWLKDRKTDKIKIKLVTGDTDTSTKMNYIKRFAPRANNGYEEVERQGGIEILISTDALSEGVNLQDADAVINFDLPWNPMVIVQRVGRVNRIGNDKDVFVLNFIPSEEIEVIVGILRKLKEKIRDITLVVGKETRILSPEEEISVETFGEKIRDISKLSMKDLEMYGISEDFKKFIPGGISQEQLDEYRLLNFIQYELKYTEKYFEGIAEMKDVPYYTFIDGNNEIISVHEFYRGRYKIMKKIVSMNPESGEVSYKTPLAFISLVERGKKSPKKIDLAIESLKKITDEIEKIKEEMKEKYQVEQRGFLYHLYNALLYENERVSDIKDKYLVVMTTLQSLPYYLYTREIKPLLIEKKLIEMKRDSVVIRDVKGVVETLYEFFTERGMGDIESLKIRVEHLGWYYEV